MPSKTNAPNRRGTNRPGAKGGRAARRRAARGAPTRSSLGRFGPWLAVGMVLVVVAVFVIAKVASSPPAPAKAATPAPADVVKSVTAVPASVLAAVGAGSVDNPPKALPAGAAPLTSAGQPLVVYMGAEYCPYCAAERWAMVQALSRFGSFSGLGTTESSAGDVYPSTPTFTFHGSTYRSPYLVFTPVETQSNQADPSGGYKTLETPTALESRLISTFDRSPYASTAGAIPFIDIGGRFIQSGASYDPGALQGLTLRQVAAQLSDPSSKAAQGVDGTANVLAAAICRATGGKPEAVCSSRAVTKAAAALGAG